MKMVIQRVDEASVTVNGSVCGKIEKGFLVLLGVGHGDSEAIADKMIKKMTGLRIFSDENGKTNLSLKDVGGNLLIISQFTLYADCKHGYRPSFTEAGAPDEAERLYEYVLSECRKEFPDLQHGMFGEHMDVKLQNNGPFTILLDSEELYG
ncbi:MAG: D-tyrosyl-tRNA(Tyr) deacylase [Lachnospiraceae bacterium]|nr:D-tyrosyl-tRNA(Tyr) deacylase [Lachnospiraceae bacterium]